ncbi:importin-13 isoform X1 [Brachionus plicatilis]|uniref:Importin-13 isoform X1 n=1 Tax=Brachionus plicatilis TaxID=10195 RepID=A0A3M7SNR2_BRAPC|nr:importin-13 isoform X1 [Brachionus plicatilis]
MADIEINKTYYFFFEALKAGFVAQNYENRIMSIIGMCLSDLLIVEYQKSINWLQSIVEPYILKLGELAQLKQIDKNTQSLTCHILNLVSQLMSSLIQRQQNHNSTDIMANDSTASSVNTSFQVGNGHGAIVNTSNDERAIVNSLLIKLIPIYKQIISRNLSTDLIIIDKLFESISVTLSSNIACSNPQPENEITEAILNELIQMFYILNENSWRKFAYEVCRQILIIWWKNDKYKNNLSNLFLFSYQNAMKLMTRDMNWFHDHTDVVEQYCTCLAKLLKSKYYDLFEKLNEESLVYLLKFAQLGLQLPEQYTLRAVATFLEEFVKFTKLKNNLMEFLEKNSLNLLHIMMMGISGALPRHLVDILSGILYIFVKEYPQLTNSLLNQILIKNDFQPYGITQQSAATAESQTTSLHLSKEQKQGFVKSILSESSNKRKFKEIITEFSLICRGLINTQYAKETSQKF